VRGGPVKQPRRPPSEDELLRWLRQRFALPLIGDDAAILPASRAFAVTVDSQVAGIHFVADLDPACVARRLLAVNLSDLAAMGARPRFAFLSLTAPPGFDHRRFFRALVAACQGHRLRLAGGDLSRSPTTGWVATMTLLGSKSKRGRWLQRSTALAGQALWLGGSIGESGAGRLLLAAGASFERGRVVLPAAWAASVSRSLSSAARRAVRRHLAPEPQIELGSWLARQGAGAAMDISDGLARDLPRLCRESAVGALLETDRLPYSVGFAALCDKLRVDPEDTALRGGEDYVLLFTLPRGVKPPPRFGCRRIGEMTTAQGVTVVSATGVRSRLLNGGWDHLLQEETSATAD
jgi:thiamine-monophosphate kinase